MKISRVVHTIRSFGSSFSGSGSAGGSGSGVTNGSFHLQFIKLYKNECNWLKVRRAKRTVWLKK